MGREQRKEIASEALKKVGLEDRMFHKPSELSGGQQQRVAIARAIAGSPALLLADEPTGNLDSRSELDIFQKLNQQGMTILIVTHDEVVAEHCKRIIRVKDGLLVNNQKIEIRKDANDALQSIEIGADVG